ncbi:MAG: ABC transporter ATP-binding protein [Anaerolineaceae bacterium]|nr:ABC transporter ATP-binding protein [Anaerolineaceae bacterium]
MDAAISVQNVSKKFRAYHPQKPNTIAELVVKGPTLLRAEDQFWALRDVSFQLGRGQMLGIIGKNGAGKSTLLRLIGGVGRPDDGRIQVNGRIGALLDLGAGFHPDLTGRENVFISGVISGLLRQEIEERFDSIVAFAELEAFIDNPLRTYSTGMQLRLAFAVAAHIDPEVLLIDEVLAVGDLAFQRKCLDRIAQFRQKGCTILLVSHDANQVQQLCDDVLWLRQGQVVAHGEPAVVVGQYVAEMQSETRRRTPEAVPLLHATSGQTLQINKNRFGSLEMEITAVHLQNTRGEVLSDIESGEGVAVVLEVEAPTAVPSPIVGVTISREDGTVCYDTHTQADGMQLGVWQGKKQIALQLERLDLTQGVYFVDVGIYEANWSHAYDYHWHVYPLLVTTGEKEKGMLSPPARWIGPE